MNLMKAAWLGFALLAPVTLLSAPASGAARAGDPSTNTIINCLQGVLWQPTNMQFRGSVRVFDPQIYIECELLNVHFPSNNAAGNLEAGATPNLGRVTSIDAQSNLLMMLRGATIIGDRALYSATNDIIHITGEIVVIETENGYAYGTNFMFDRRTMELHSIGPSTLESKPGVSLMDTTNSFPGPGPGRGANPANRPRRNPPGTRPNP